MQAKRSPEVESVARRALFAYNFDPVSLGNLMSSDPGLRVVGSDLDEWWSGPQEVLSVRETQMKEAGLTETERSQFRVDQVEGYQDGDFGWAAMIWTLVTVEAETQLRTTATMRLEAGVWRVIQWHNSIPVANEQVYGVDLTRTLDDLVSSILDDEESISVGPAAEGTMTLVFTDIVDSTHIAESVGDEAWAEIVADHQSMISEETAAHGGAVVKFLGDGSMLSFQSARAAVRTAIELQSQNQKARLDTPYAIRIGVHSGEVMQTGTDLLGLTVNKAARIAAAADGGEIMLSSTTKDLVGPLDGTETSDPKTVRLKGIAGSHQIVPIKPA